MEAARRDLGTFRVRPVLARQLAQEERIAARQPGRPLRHGVGKPACSGSAGEDALALVLREPGHAQPHGRAQLRVAQEPAQRRAGLFFPIREESKEGRGAARPQDRADQFERSLAGPVHVFEDEHRRTRRREPRDREAHRVEEARAFAIVEQRDGIGQVAA